jgi:hypothetical protein
VTLPTKLVDLLAEKHQGTVITTVSFQANGEVVARRQFKSPGGEDISAWCEANWQSRYTWQASVTPYKPAQVTYADGSREPSK